MEDRHSSKSEHTVVAWFMLLERREQGNSSRSGASAVGRRVWCRLLRCTSMPDPPVCWNWSVIYERSLVFDISCTQLKTEIESHVSSRGSGRLLYTFSYAYFHLTMPENSDNSACLLYMDTTFEIGTTYCHLCRTNLKKWAMRQGCKLPGFLSPFIFWKSTVCFVTFFLPSHS